MAKNTFSTKTIEAQISKKESQVEKLKQEISKLKKDLIEINRKELEKKMKSKNISFEDLMKIIDKTSEDSVL